MCFLIFSETQFTCHIFGAFISITKNIVYLHNLSPFFRMIKFITFNLSKIEKVFIYTGEIMYYVFYFLLPNKHIASVPTTASPTLPPLTKYSCLDYVIIRKKAPTHSLMKLCIWSITHL